MNKPARPIPNPDNVCRCGKGTCSLHETSTEMKLAMHYLSMLNDTQRSRLFCWFCTHCGRELPPGAPGCPCQSS